LFVHAKPAAGSYPRVAQFCRKGIGKRVIARIDCTNRREAGAARAMRYSISRWCKGRASFLFPLLVRRIVAGATLTAATLGIGATVCVADQSKCESQNPSSIDKREGSQNGSPIQFNFESRVEKYINVARRYTWCVENTSKYLVGDFRWGTDPNVGRDSRYFNAIVEPGKVTPFVRTDSSDVRNALRYLGVRPLNSTSWTTITTETIFNSHIGEKEYEEDRNSSSRSSLVQRVQFQAATDSTMPIDIVDVSRDRNAFVTLLEKGKINFQDSMVATIPTSPAVMTAIESGKYEEYNPKDFVRARIRLENNFFLSDGAPVSEIYISIFPEADNDTPRLGEALTAITSLLVLYPSAQSQPYPKQLGVIDIAKIGSRLVLRQSAAELNHVSATLALGSKASKATIASLPVDVLIGK